MAEKLTNTQIKQKYLNTPQERTKLIRLINAKNLYLRVTKNGVCAFVFRYVDRNTGKETTIVIGHPPSMQVETATAEAIKLQSQRDSGIRNPNIIKRIEKSKLKTLADMLEIYKKEKIAKFKPSTVDSQISAINKINEVLGEYLLADLTTELIKTKLLDPYANAGMLAQARRVKLILDYSLQHATNFGYINKNPIKLITEKYWTSEIAIKNSLFINKPLLKEFVNSIFTSNISNRVKYQLWLLLLLACRKGEIVDCKLSDINFDEERQLWLFHNFQSKVEALNIIPLSDKSVKIIEKLKLTSKGDWLISTRTGKKPERGNYFNDHLNSLTINQNKGADKRITPHDLRRAFVNLCNDSELFLPHAIELAVGHVHRT